MKLQGLKRTVLLLFALLLIVGTFACSKVPEDPVNADEPNGEESADGSELPDTAKPIEDETQEIADDGYINPLTGERTEEDISGKRPVTVMLNNYSIALPQLGVGDADIIYEAIVEGGITRMMAVFQNLPETEVIGSVRSARHSYLDFASAYDAIQVHAGGSIYADEDFVSRGMDHIDGVNGRGDLFYRDAYRRSAMGFEHSLCITGKNILDYLNNESGFRLVHNDSYKCNMVFTEDAAPKEGSTAANVAVHFGCGKDTKFSYNAEKQVYNAAEFGNTYIDGNTGEAVDFKNVIVIQTDVWTIDSSDRKDMTLTGTGKGWFMCDGKCAEITWNRDNKDAQFEYTFADGTPLEYGIGSTYICVISLAGSIECN